MCIKNLLAKLFGVKPVPASEPVETPIFDKANFERCERKVSSMGAYAARQNRRGRLREYFDECEDAKHYFINGANEIEEGKLDIKNANVIEELERGGIITFVPKNIEEGKLIAKNYIAEELVALKQHLIENTPLKSVLLRRDLFCFIIGEPQSNGWGFISYEQSEAKELKKYLEKHIDFLTDEKIEEITEKIEILEKVKHELHTDGSVSIKIPLIDSTLLKKITLAFAHDFSFESVLVLDFKKDLFYKVRK